MADVKRVAVALYILRLFKSGIVGRELSLEFSSRHFLCGVGFPHG